MSSIEKLVGWDVCYDGAKLENGISSYPNQKILSNILSGDYIKGGTLNMNNKVRGFELISINQAVKDFSEEQLKGVELILPKRGTKRSAGYDFFAPFDIVLKPNEEIKVPTGVKAYMLNDEVLHIYPRSGLGFNYYCRLANTVGVVDSDYYDSDNEGHIFVKLRNEGTKEMVIEKGEGMCQGIFSKYLLVDGDDFRQGEDRNGGFGSTTK